MANYLESAVVISSRSALLCVAGSLFAGRCRRRRGNSQQVYQYNGLVRGRSRRRRRAPSDVPCDIVRTCECGQ